MNVLPRLSYLFQTITAGLLEEKILKLGKKPISKPIWKEKRPRIRFKMLQLPKKNRGLFLPNIKNYFGSAVKTTSKHMM